MLHPSTKKLIDKLSEMTRKQRVSWIEGENGTIVHDTEGYRVVLSPEPHGVTLTDAVGREIETCSPEEIADEKDSAGRPYSQFVGELFREAHRHARGTEKAIRTLMAGLEAAEEEAAPAAEAAPVEAEPEAEPETVTDETASMEGETAITAAVATLADQINSTAPMAGPEVATPEAITTEPEREPEPEPETASAEPEPDAAPAQAADEPAPEPDWLSAPEAEAEPQAEIYTQPEPELEAQPAFEPEPVINEAPEEILPEQTPEPAPLPAAYAESEEEGEPEPEPEDTMEEAAALAAPEAAPETEAEAEAEPAPEPELAAQTETETPESAPERPPEPAPNPMQQRFSLSGIPYGVGFAGTQSVSTPEKPAEMKPAEEAQPLVIDGTEDLPEAVHTLDESDLPPLGDGHGDQGNGETPPAIPRRFNPWN